jgi:hypothetical protein
LTGFSVWDDEGSFMISVQQYMEGHKLYAELSSRYGPIYYFYKWAVHTLSGTPVTHDAVRLLAMIPLLVGPLICAWYILQLTRSLALASIAHLGTVFIMLRFFTNEPGHPQELCIFLLICFIAAGQLSSNQRWRSVGVVLLGVIAAALCLIKVNIGLFVIMGGVLSILFHLPRTWITRCGLVVTALAAIALPLVLMKSRLDDPRVQALLFIVTGSLVALFLRLVTSRSFETIRWRSWYLAASAFIAVFIAVLLSLTARGIGVFTVLDSLVLSNIQLSLLSETFFVPPPLTIPWALVAVAAVAACALFIRFEREQTRSPEGASSAVSILKVVMGTAAIGLSFIWTPLGLTPFLAWLAVSPPPSIQSFARTLLCAVGVLQILYAFPVAGSQNEFIKIPLLLMATLCVGDVVASVPSSARAWQKSVAQVTAVLLVAVLLSYAAMIHRSKQRYDSLPSLALKGAERIHLDPKQARQYQWLTANIDRYCDVIFGLPNIPSLHFWTGRQPITTLTWDAWFLVATAEDQRSIQAALSEHRDACIVYNPDLVAFWNRSGILDVDSLPLVQYIHAEFTSAMEMDGFRLLIKNNRSLKDASTGAGKTL